ncbi:MAG TPA: hypothetical protein VH682_03345 [Gemmataceae bacterium]|jgi:hypothetical protein
MKPRTYDKAKAVVKAAKEEPEKFGDLKEKMDATGKVAPAYKDMQRLQNERTIRSTPRAGVFSDPNRLGTDRRSPTRT